ncbi:hypothetical protein CC80DRAFT_489637 [Byssothecium circinans]|uniref:Uncharacterized protein n=1 Tax=Byssothecium circinans TaxID=147558 RepID=A0A6A5U4B8_9PLEO|nr:hypothetical protein CC80DRAFT_489637 [Byssothecium circinans]
MHFSSYHFTLLFSALAAGLPFDGAVNVRNVVRSKSYAVVNVDGGFTEAPSASSTVNGATKTKTVEVTQTATTKTSQVTPTVDPTTTKSSQSMTSSSPAVVTIIITAPAEPTTYYDDGFWHTSYVSKTWSALSTVPAGTSSPTAFPASE